jgi:hypothetical protein
MFHIHCLQYNIINCSGTGSFRAVGLYQFLELWRFVTTWYRVYNLNILSAITPCSRSLYHFQVYTLSYQQTKSNNQAHSHSGHYTALTCLDTPSLPEQKILEVYGVKLIHTPFKLVGLHVARNNSNRSLVWSASCCEVSYFSVISLCRSIRDRNGHCYIW